MEINMKKLPCLIFIITIILSIFSIPNSAKTKFDDIVSNSWYFEAVEWCHDNAYMSGTSNTTFSPNGQVSREMVITVLAAYSRADLSQYKEDTSINNKLPFTDVLNNKWYSSAIRWGYANGLCAGISKQTFGIGKPITRAELATFFFKFAEYRKLDNSYRGKITTFQDIPDGKWYSEPLLWAIGEGLISGTTDNTAAPLGNATRAQFAIILRAYDNYEKSFSPIPAENNPHKDFKPVMRFIIGSDIHISDDDERPQNYFAKMFTSSYAYADSHPTYNKIDAFVIAGDLVNTCSETECKIYNDLIENNMRSESTYIATLGNHEYYGALSNESDIEKALGAYDRIHTVVSGFHFIGLSPIDGGEQPYYTKMEWLKKELKAAYEDTPNKPIFVFQHHPVHTGTDALTKEFNSILSQYPNVIDFSGHWHEALSKRSVVQGNYTNVILGTLGSYTSSNSYDSSQDAQNEKANSFMVVEVSEKGEVFIRPYNIYSNRFWRTPSNLDNSSDELFWYIERPWDKTTFNYIGSVIYSIPPIFGRHAEITLKNVTASSVTFSFPVAQSWNGISNYHIVITDTETSEIKSDRRLSGFNYLDEPPLSITKLISGLLPGRTYKMTVSATDISYYETESPLSCIFTTLK